MKDIVCIFRISSKTIPTIQKTQLMIDCARLSRIAYKEPHFVKSDWNKAHDSNNTTYYHDPISASVFKKIKQEPIFCNSPIGDSQAYTVIYCDDGIERLILACRGTSSIQDALCDANVGLKPINEFRNLSSPVRAHGGFLLQFRALQTLFDPIVHNYMEQNNRKLLLCTGHSMGSAIGIIAALVYSLKYPNRVSYIGIGTPRVGNLAFKKEFDSRVAIRVRIKHGRDLVCKIASAARFAHVGHELHIGRRDPYPHVPLLTDIPDHDCVKYIERLIDDTPQDRLTINKYIISKCLDFFGRLLHVLYS